MNLADFIFQLASAGSVGVISDTLATYMQAGLTGMEIDALREVVASVDITSLLQMELVDTSLLEEASKPWPTWP